MFCPNNKKHILKQSIHTPTSYLCNSCKNSGNSYLFDIKDLNKTDTILVTKLNKDLQELINLNIYKPHIFAAMIKQNNNDYILSFINRTNNNSVPYDEISESVKNIFFNIKKYLENNYSISINWE